MVIRWYFCPLHQNPASYLFWPPPPTPPFFYVPASSSQHPTLRSLPDCNQHFWSSARGLTPLLAWAFNITSRWCPTVQTRCNNRPPSVTRKHQWPPYRLTTTRKTDNQLLYPFWLTDPTWIDWFPNSPDPESLPSSTQAAGSTWYWGESGSHGRKRIPPLNGLERFTCIFPSTLSLILSFLVQSPIILHPPYEQEGVFHGRPTRLLFRRSILSGHLVSHPNFTRDLMSHPHFLLPPPSPAPLQLPLHWAW